jgi:hypothetical protein
LILRLRGLDAGELRIRNEGLAVRFCVGRPVQSAYPAGPTAILHRPDAIMIVAVNPAVTLVLATHSRL